MENNTLKSWITRLVKLFIGLFFYALGIVITINANLGLAPWDILNDGVSKQVGISFGTASIGIGVFIVALDFILQEKIGIGTLLNMIFIGIFVDILQMFDVVPAPEYIALQVLMLFAGMVVISFAMYFYVQTGLGIGPRDGLMVALVKKTGKSVRLCRTATEVVVAFAGWLLGGDLGVGTVIMAVCFGYVTQMVFRLVKFDIKAVRHQYIDDDIRRYLARRKAAAKGENTQDESGSC